MNKIFYIDNKEISEEELKNKYNFGILKNNCNYVNYTCIEKFTSEEIVDYLNSIEGEDLWMSSNWITNWSKDDNFFIRTTKNNHLYYLNTETAFNDTLI